MSDTSNWSEWQEGRGFIYDHKIRIDGTLVRPIAKVYHWDKNLYIAELHIPNYKVDQYSREIDARGMPGTNVGAVDSEKQGLKRVDLFTERYNSAEEIRKAINAPS